MSEVKIELSDDQFARLRKVASESGASFEFIIQQLVQTFLDGYREEERAHRIDEVMNRVIRKNLDLYRRLAR